MADDRRELPGVPGFEIDRFCNVYPTGGAEKVEISWPYADLKTDDGQALVHVAAAVADAFIPREDHLDVFSDVCAAKSKSSTEVQSAAERYGVSPWAILHLGKVDPEPAVKWIEDGDAESEESAAVHEIPLTEFDDYPKPRLKEHSRPPSRGGNTGALHRHTLIIRGEPYSWLALGARKWAYKGDRVSFRYTVTAEGFRNVLKNSFRAFDPDGHEVVRGNRGFKPKLRRSPTK